MNGKSRKAKKKKKKKSTLPGGFVYSRAGEGTLHVRSALAACAASLEEQTSWTNTWGRGGGGGMKILNQTSKFFKIFFYEPVMAAFNLSTAQRARTHSIHPYAAHLIYNKIRVKCPPSRNGKSIFSSYTIS